MGPCYRRGQRPRGEDSDHAARATGIVLDILRRLDTIGGLIPEKPLIQLQQQNVMVGGVTFADLLREAMDGAGQVVEVDGLVCDNVDPG